MSEANWNTMITRYEGDDPEQEQHMAQQKAPSRFDAHREQYIDHSDERAFVPTPQRGPTRYDDHLFAMIDALYSELEQALERIAALESR